MQKREYKIRQMVDICEQYYLKGRNQQDIATELGLSRPSVSRLLNQARAEGIVTITVHNPYSNEQQYATQLEACFGLHRAIVVSASESDFSGFQRAQAEAATYLLDCELRDGDILGVMGGTTLNQLSEQIGEINRTDLTIVPLIGGWGPASAMWQANLNVRNFGERWNCRYDQLNAPAIVSAPAAKEVLMREPEIQSVLSQAVQSHVALVGIGNVSSDSSLFHSGLLTDGDISRLQELDIVASLCNFFLDRDGNSVEFIDTSRTIGIETEQLRRIPRVIAVASGEKKVDAILAALTGHWVDSLITGPETARLLLEKAGKPTS